MMLLIVWLTMDADYFCLYLSILCGKLAKIAQTIPHNVGYSSHSKQFDRDNEYFGHGAHGENRLASWFIQKKGMELKTHQKKRIFR